MPRMHHEVSLLNDAKIREEASIWSAGLCGFYFCVFSSQNIAGLRLHLAICGMMNFMNFTRNSKPRSSSSISPQSRLIEVLSERWRWNKIFLSTQLSPAAPQPEQARLSLFSSPGWTCLGLAGAERGEDDHDTRQGERWRWRSPPDLEENVGDGPGWTVWAGPLWSHCNNFSLIFSLSSQPGKSSVLSSSVPIWMFYEF